MAGKRRPSDPMYESVDLEHEPLQQWSERGGHRRKRSHKVAYAGWSLAFLLILVLALSHSTLAPKSLPRLNLGKLQRPSTGVTIVSAFFLVSGGKKHSIDDYHGWLANFLGNVELPIVFFCAPSLVDKVTELRGNLPITIISDYASAFDMPPIVDLGGRKWSTSQHLIDPEKTVQVAELYAVWTAKPWMVQQVSLNNTYNSKYFFWADAGGFRDTQSPHNFRGLPATIDSLYNSQSLPEDTIVLASIKPFETELNFVESATTTALLDRSDRIQGGWYGGQAAGIEWWAKETMKVTIQQGMMGRFSAKEQPVWTQTARLNWPKIFVQNMRLREGDCGADVWFTYEWFADGKRCLIPGWSGPSYSTELRIKALQERNYD